MKMKTRSSALYRRTVRYSRRDNSGTLAAVMAVLLASLPLGVLAWAIPTTGLGIA
jgi:hypothetical protein